VTRRPPFTLALVGLVVLLTGLTAAIIGGLAGREHRTRSLALLSAAMAQAARLTAAHAERSGPALGPTDSLRPG